MTRKTPITIAEKQTFHNCRKAGHTIRFSAGKANISRPSGHKLERRRRTGQLQVELMQAESSTQSELLDCLIGDAFQELRQRGLASLSNSQLLTLAGRSLSLKKKEPQTKNDNAALDEILAEFESNI